MCSLNIERVLTGHEDAAGEVAQGRGAGRAEHPQGCRVAAAQRGRMRTHAAVREDIL